MLAVTIAGARVALGAVAIAAPRAASRPWVGAATAGPASAVLGRALGGRDVALGLGALLASRRSAPLRGWVEAGGLADCGDVTATLLSFGRLPRWGRWVVLAASVGAAASAAVVAPSL
jgi:hypothetical protein